MSRVLIDLVGRRFGRYVVIRLVDRVQTTNGTVRPRWLCRCDCGTTRVVQGASLRSSGTLSCGCINRENVVQRCTKHGHASRAATTPEWRTWAAMRQRCHNPRSKTYAYYGGRGIEVCPEWRDDFSRFLADMGPRPRGTSLDRIDNDGMYCPSNCRWATPKEQRANCRRIHWVEFQGQRMNMSQAAEKFHINREALKYRLSRGWPAERALTEPVR